MLQPGDERFDLLHQFQDHTLRPLLRDARWIHASGYGEPFASRLYRELLTTLEPDEAPFLEFCFLTNGLGFDEAFYNKMPLKHRIESISVSIDAATEATYGEVRGGSWTRLQTNLAFMSRLRAKEKIARLEMGFVYQAANWRELPDFVAWAEGLGADKVMVYTLLPHGHKQEAYDERAVGLPAHPDYEAAEAELKRVEAAARVAIYIERPNPERAGVDLCESA
jgi:MoaA/NifB/PqqE/SkfB family radical SAM enzyme